MQCHEGAPRTGLILVWFSDFRHFNDAADWMMTCFSDKLDSIQGVQHRPDRIIMRRCCSESHNAWVLEHGAKFSCFDSGFSDDLVLGLDNPQSTRDQRQGE